MTDGLETFAWEARALRLELREEQDRSKRYQEYLGLLVARLEALRGEVLEAIEAAQPRQGSLW